MGNKLRLYRCELCGSAQLNESRAKCRNCVANAMKKTNEPVDADLVTVFDADDDWRKSEDERLYGSPDLQPGE